MAKPEDNHDDFEIVNESELQFAKRGRKSEADPAIVQAIAKLTPGKVLAVNKLKVDPKDKTRKANVSAKLRSSAELAGVVVDIKFTIDGVPTVRLSSRSKKTK